LIKKAALNFLLRLVFERPPARVPPMPSDRPYLRDDYPRERTSVLTWLISAMIAGFAVQFVTSSPWVSAGRSVEHFLALTIPALERGWIWTLVTHGFLHSTGFIVHGIFNVFALYFLGRELLPILGARRFLSLFAAATVVGGCLWTAAHWRFGGGDSHIGATPAVAALFTFFACIFPKQPLSFLLFFVFPVTLLPKHLVMAFAGVAAFGFVVYELPGATLPLEISLSSSAHLGGILTGLFYFRFVHEANWSFRRRGDEIELPRWMKRGRKVSPVPPEEELPADVAPAPLTGKENIRAEVDRILDKINSEGLNALTPAEKSLLDNAKDLLSRR
jgi:membrane associated rhomboid family serine protease